MEHTIKVNGALKSKANSRMAVPGRTKTGKNFTRFIKSTGAQEFEETALWQIKKQWGRKNPLSGNIAIETTVYYPSNRNDLDTSLWWDVLQRAGVIENDRMIVESHDYKAIDKENPRVESTLWLL